MKKAWILPQCPIGAVFGDLIKGAARWLESAMLNSGSVPQPKLLVDFAGDTMSIDGMKAAGLSRDVVA